MENERKDFARLERLDGILDVKVHCRSEPIFKEITLDEDEEMTGLIFNFEGTNTARSLEQKSGSLLQNVRGPERKI